MATTKLMTGAELFELDDDGNRYELMDGELVSNPPSGEVHARRLAQLSLHIGLHVEDQDLGYCYVGNPGLLLTSDPDTVLAPDIAFVRKERAASILDQPGFIELAPDLVVEVLSPSDTAVHLYTKLRVYLGAGVELIRLVDPRAASITVYQADQPTRFLASGDIIDGGAVLPGFQMRVGDLLG